MLEDNIVVVSARQTGTPTPPGFTEVKISRPSVLANPYRMKNPLETERRKVIKEFKKFLTKEEQWKEASPVREEILSLAARLKGGEKIALKCWCAPKKCHGDVIRDAVLSIAHQEREVV